MRVKAPAIMEQDTYPSHSAVAPDEDLSLAECSRAPAAALIDSFTRFAHHKRLLAAITSAVMLGGVAYCLMLPVLYTATTRIMTPQQSQSSAALLMSQLTNSGAGSLVAAAGSGLSLKDPNGVYIGLLGSRPIADTVIQRFGLAKVYRAKDMTAARSRLKENTKIVSEKSGFIAVSVTDKDKNRAAAIANAYTEQLRVLTTTLALTEASQRRLFYEEQLKYAREALITAELSFQQVQQKKGLVQLDAQAKSLIVGIADLRAEIAAKTVELQALRSYSTERNPAVQLAETQLASLAAESSQLEQRKPSPGSSDVGLQDMARAGIEYLRAEHEMQYRQVVFDLLLKQFDAARLDEAKDAAVIQVVEPAIPPDQKSSPHRAQIVLTFTVFGFLIALSYLSVRHFLQGSPDVARSLTGLGSALLGR
jgi:tyrosine-protein kinase Etk/Wzc